MKKYTFSVLLSAIIVTFTALPGFGVSKETIQMMTQLDTLQQEVQALQRTVDTQGAVIKTLLQQTSSNVGAMKAAVAKMLEADQRNLASTGNRFDAMDGQIQQISSSLDETKGELSKLSDQLAETQKIIQTINTPPPASDNSAQSGGATASGTPNGGTDAPLVPDPQTLYDSAYADYTQGQYPLAIQGFQQYLQDYGDTDLASNAQFYIGDSYYAQKDYKNAIKEYDQCIQLYPKGNKAAAAYLKKSYALLALNQHLAGERELSLLIRKYPASREANLAKERLHRLRMAHR